MLADSIKLETSDAINQDISTSQETYTPATQTDEISMDSTSEFLTGLSVDDPDCYEGSKSSSMYDCSEGESKISSPYDWKHQCISAFEASGLYAATRCTRKHRLTPVDLFECSQAECQVCVDLNWKYFL